MALSRYSTYEDVTASGHRASRPGHFMVIDIDEAYVPRCEQTYEVEGFEAAKAKAEKLAAATSVTWVVDDEGQCLFSAGQDAKADIVAGEAPSGTKFEGRVSDEAFHEEMLESEEGEDAADLLAIHSAIELGFEKEEAIRMCANPRLRKRLLGED